MKLDSVSELYARMLQVLAIAGMVLLLLTFVIYVSGLLPSAVSPERVTELWHLDSASFNEITDGSFGWEWVSNILRGNNLAFASLVFLALCTLICMIVLAPAYLRAGDKRYATIVTLEAVVLTVAAAGIFVVH